MQHRWLLLGALLAVGCGNSYPVLRQQGSISTVTFPMALGNYSRVYNTTYHIVNRYAVIRDASYKQGVIEAELSQDTALFEKTRRTILARLFDQGEYWDVECRVLIEVETSDVETLGSKQPRYKWTVMGYDQFLETRLNSEIKGALTGGAWQSKAPLVYQGVGSQEAGVRFKVLDVPEEVDADEIGPEKSSGGKAERTRQAAAPKSSALEPELERALDRAQRRLEKEDAPQSSRQVAQAPADHPSSMSARELERVGVHYLQRADYSKAENTFLAALAKDPSSVAAPFLLAQVRFAQGQYSKAALALKDGLPQASRWDEARIDPRSFSDSPERFAQQLANLRSHLKKTPKDTDAATVLGWLQYATGDGKSAESTLSLVLSVQPENGVAAHALRQARIQQALQAGSLKEF